MAAARFSVRYLAGASGTTDITSAVVAGSYSTADVPLAGIRTIRAVIRVRPSGPDGATKRCALTSTSVALPTASDTVEQESRSSDKGPSLRVGARAAP